MNIKKCDGCGKLLTKEDDFFTVDEINFHKGKSKKTTIRVHFSDENKDNIYNMDESWCSYSDFDFCPKC